MRQDFKALLSVHRFISTYVAFEPNDAYENWRLHRPRNGSTRE